MSADEEGWRRVTHVRRRQYGESREVTPTHHKYGRNGGCNCQQSREWEKRRGLLPNQGQRQNEAIYTLFVDNIHPNMINKDLRAIFQKIGRVEDTFISRKTRAHTRSKFGFVRFRSYKLATEAIRKINGKVVEGGSLAVKWSQFDRMGRKENHVDNKLNTTSKEVVRKAKHRWNSFRDKRSFKEVVEQRRHIHGDQKQMKESRNESETQVVVDRYVTNERGERALHYKPSLRKIKGVSCTTRSQWLQRSLMLETRCPLESHEVSQIVNNWNLGSTKITDLGKFKFIVTFEDVGVLEKALQAIERNLNSKCVSVRKWSNREECRIRCVWVEIFGIPPIGWNSDNMERVTKSIGKVLWIEPRLEDSISMGSAKVQLQTDHMSFIEDHLILQIGEDEFEIFIRELEHPVRHIPTYFCVEQGDTNHANFYKDPKMVNEGEKMKEGLAEVEDDDVASGRGRALNVINDYVSQNAAEDVEQCDGQCVNYDNIVHLPSRECEKALEAVDNWDWTCNFVEAEESHVSTQVAPVSYSLGQELELLNQFKEIDRGPPGFDPNEPNSPFLSDLDKTENSDKSISGPQSLSTVPNPSIVRHVESCNTGHMYPVESSNENSETRLRYEGEPRPRTTKNSIKVSISTSKDIDDEDENDVQEALETLNVGKRLNLVAQSDERVVQGLVNLRRSQRKKKKGGSIGNGH